MIEILGILGTRVLPELLLKGAVVLLAAAGLAWSLRRASAATRQAVWAVAAGLLVALPLGMRAAPDWGLPVMAPAWSADVGVRSPASDAPRSGPEQAMGSGTVPGMMSPVVRSSPDPVVGGDGTADGRPTLPWALRLGAAAFLLWAGGVLVRMALAARDLFRIRMVTRYGSVPAPAGARRLADAVGRELGLTRRLRVRSSHWTEVPVTWGIWRPVILLPPGTLDHWPGLRAALIHEAAHVRRLDYAWHMLGEVALALHWPNPLAWWARRRMRAEQERACDDVVLRHGTGATDYADQLVEIARSLSRPVLNATTAMARGPVLGHRLDDILNRALDRSPLAPGKAWGRGLALTVVALAAAGATVHDPASAPASLEDLYALAGNRSPAALEAIQQQLTSTQAEVRGVAALSLGEREDPAAIPTLVGLLKDPDPWVRENAAVALTRLRGSGRAEPVAAVLRRDSVASVRSVAAWSLGEMGGTVARDALAEAAATDSDPHTRGMAAGALVEIQDVDVVPDLVARLARAPSDHRAPLLYALGQLDDLRAAGALSRVARTDPDPQVRHAALHAMSARDPMRIAVWSERAAEDEAWRVRNMAVVRLGEDRDPRAVAPLVRALRDPVHQVRLNAAWALRGRGH